MMIIPSPQYSGSASEWLNNQTIEHHSIIEIEEEVFIFKYICLIAIGVVVGQMWNTHHMICSLYPAPQLPPPK